ncbi:MAG: hypothetical protein ABI083_00075 [Lapillicoccus sp.]
MKKSLTCALALSGALAVGLSGCGSSSPTTIARATASGGTSSTSSPTSGSATSAAPAAGDSIDATALATRISDAMVKAGSGKGKITSSGGSAATQTNGSLAFSIEGSTTKAQGTFTLAGQTMEIVTTGKVIYLKGLPTQMSGGKPWVKIDPQGTDALSKSMAQLGTNTGDPRALVDSFKGGQATVKSKTATTTTYAVTGATALAGGTLDVTVDAQDLPSTFTVTTSGVTVTAEYSDWGAPVTITEPPADQVGTASVPTG